MDIEQRVGNHAAVARPGAISAVTSIVLCALAGGVLWCFVSVSTVYDTATLIIPIGGLIGAFLRWQGLSGKRGMAGAATAVLLAFGYAQFLFGAVRVAQLMGFPLRQVLFKADTMLIAHAAWFDLQRSDWIYLALAVAVGAVVVGYRNRGLAIRDYGNAG